MSLQDCAQLIPHSSDLFEFLSVHALMVSDKYRLNQFSRAIKKQIKPGDIVADIGTGTGLLAFLCLKAGAKRVHAIESSSSIRWAKSVAKANGFDGRMVFHHNNSMKVDLGEKVNLIISELIGHVGFEEGIAGCLVDARKRFLAPGGRVIPLSLQLCSSLVTETDCYQKYIDCWTNIDGIDFSALKSDAIQSVYIARIDEQKIVSEPSVIAHIDFENQIKPVFKTKHVFKASRASIVTGLALWFKSDLADGIMLSSMPGIETHWQQCFIPAIQHINVKKNQNVCARIDMNFCPTTFKIKKICVNLTKQL